MSRVANFSMTLSNVPRSPCHNCEACAWIMSPQFIALAAWLLRHNQAKVQIHRRSASFTHIAKKMRLTSKLVVLAALCPAALGAAVQTISILDSAEVWDSNAEGRLPLSRMDMAELARRAMVVK